MTWNGSSWPGVRIDTVAPGSVSPSSVYVVVASSTSMTAVAGWVTAIVGGLAKRRTWTPEVDPEGDDDDGQQRGDDDARRERHALARRRDRRGTTMAGGASFALPRSRAPLEQDLVRVEAEVQRVVAQEALGVDGARQLLLVAALEGAEVAGPDLGVAFGAVEVHALALARGVQALRQAGQRARSRDRGRRPTGRSRPPASAARRVVISHPRRGRRRPAPRTAGPSSRRST